MKGLYIHIPFCRKKCAYCDFVSYVGCEDFFDRYISAAEKEMSRYKGEKIDTVFVGGGTPSILTDSQLERLFGAIYKTFCVTDSAEITIESNPGTLSLQKLLKMRDLGINRLSIGVQSFDDGELAAIGRIHDAAAAFCAVEEAKKAGFSNINLDIMFSLPRQTRQSFAETLEKAIETGVRHISCYSLILEENTPLYKEYESGKFEPNDDETDRSIYEYACRRLQKAGYVQYEISNFCMPGYECRHNLKYWDCDEYIGIGAAAHSYYESKRYCNTTSLTKYISGEYREGGAEKITREESIKEFMIMGLRKTRGISKHEFAKRFGTDVMSVFANEIKKFVSAGLMEEKDGFIRLTFDGINVSNSILCEFV